MTVKGYLALLVGVFVVAAAPVSLEDGPLHVTASIKVASGAEDGWEGLVRRADTGLYAAKEGGRDRVVAGPSSHRDRPGGGGGEPHTGEGECGKIGTTGSGPTRHRETGIRLADQRVIGKVGRVTGTIGPDQVGEVMIAIRGGSEAFNAYAADTTDTISTGTRVVVIEYFPPRTVVVSPM